MSKIKYVYDAWGNCTITHDSNGFASRNPFRYRGYYWDSDLGMYYLITRYYDPTTGRFINSDNLNYLDPHTINALNLYAYCRNNPIMCIDPMGTEAMEDCYRDNTDIDSRLLNSGAGFFGGY